MKSLVHSPSCARILSCHSVGISTTICSFETSTLHQVCIANNFSIGTWFPIAASHVLFSKLPPRRGRGPTGIHAIRFELTQPKLREMGQLSPKKEFRCCRVPLQGAAWGCCTRVVWMLVWEQACCCCCDRLGAVPLQYMRFGPGLRCCRLPLQGAAVRVRCALWSLVSLQGLRDVYGSVGVGATPPSSSPLFLLTSASSPSHAVGHAWTRTHARMNARIDAKENVRKNVKWSVKWSQNICQRECQKGCHIENQNIWKIECQHLCQ